MSANISTMSNTSFNTSIESGDNTTNISTANKSARQPMQEVSDVLYLSIFFIIAANGLVIVLYIVRPHLRTACNCILFSLAVVDFLAAFSVPLYNACRCVKTREEAISLCFTSSQVHRFFALITVFHILAITVVQYAAILYPFQHRLLFSRRAIYKTVAMLWVVPLFVALLPVIWVMYFIDELLGPEYPMLIIQITRVYDVVCCIAGFSIPLLVIACLYIRMFIAIVKNQNYFCEGRIGRVSLRQLRGIMCRKHKRTIQIFAVLFFAYCFCWSPFYIFGLLTSFGYRLSARYILVSEIYSVFRYINCIFNPIMYTFFKRDFRKALFNLRKNPSPRVITYVKRRAYNPTRSSLLTSVSLKTLDNSRDKINERDASGVPILISYKPKHV